VSAGPLKLLGRLPGPVRLLVGGMLVNRIGSFILPYLTLVLEREFRLSAAATGQLVMAFGIGTVASVLLGGVLTDRMGRRRTLLLSLLGSGGLAALLPLAPSLGFFAVLLVIYGFLAELYRPAAFAMISDLMPSDQRALGFAALRVAVNLGFALGMVLGGALADWDWRALFVGDGATTLAFGLLVYAFVRETKPLSDAARRGEATAGGAAISPWRDLVLMEVCFASLVFSQAFFVDFTVLPLTITVSAGYPAVVYGLLVGLNGLLIAVFELPIIDALRPYRRLRVSALGVLLFSAGVALTGLVMHWAWFLLVILLWTAGEILTLPQQMSFVADWAPPEARGRYMSIHGATWSLALALGPALFLPLHERLGELAFWPVVAAVAAPAGLVALHLDRSADRPERLRGLSAQALNAAMTSEPPAPNGSRGAS
jgi:MFS family permease